WQAFVLVGDDAHIPVLELEVCRALAPALTRAGPTAILVDATCGLAGHVSALLRAAQPGRVIAFDRDPHALARARRRLADAPCRVDFVAAPVAQLVPELDRLAVDQVDAILADLGVSSLQFDSAERGFSLRRDAALDMRMDPSQGETAAELIARVDRDALTRILREFGEEPDARRIATAIVERRPQRTLELARVVEEAMSAPQRRKLGLRIHPATRTFQALRIAVNAEFDELDRLLSDAPSRLAPGGRLAMISFHSLEDRRMKQRFRELATPRGLPAGVPLRAEELPRAEFSIPSEFAKGLVPTAAEIDRNPRSRSARLRVLERD